MKDFDQKCDPKVDVKVLLKWQTPRWKSFSFLNRSGEKCCEVCAKICTIVVKNPASGIQKRSGEIQSVCYTSKSSISGNSGPRENGAHVDTELPGKRFNKNAKIGIPRGSADL